MSQWAGIESAATDAPGARPAPLVARRPPRLRPTERLIVGSIDGAAHVLQRRARDVLLGSAIFMVPMVAVGVLLAVVVYNRFDTMDTMFGDRGYVGAEVAFVFLAVSLESFTAHLVGAYTAAYLVRYQMGGDPGIREPALAVLRRVPVLLVTWLLTHWWALLADLWLLNVDQATLVALIWIAPMVATMLSTCVLLVAPVMMGEGLGVAAIGRGWRLVRNRFGAALGFVVACALLAVMLFSFIAFLPQLVESTGLVTFGSYMWLLQGVTSQLALLVVVPFTAIATAQLYLQFRVHAEGLDIVIAADRAFGHTP